MNDGIGKLERNDGSVYIGEFRKQRLDGRGIRTYPDGRVEKGLFKDDEFIQAFHFDDSDLF